MTEANRSQASSSLVRQLHRALLDLYDPAALAKSRLTQLLGVAQHADPPAALRRVLLEAVEALKPDDQVPPQAEAWRIYHVLRFRYVEQIPQREIATSLALSVRHLRRHENVALQALANYLWGHHGLQLRAEAPAAGQGQEATAAVAGGQSQELEWLRTSFASEAVSMAELIEAVLKTLAPLLEAGRVSVVSSVPESLPRLAVHTITMRQALVNVLTAAARRVPGGRIAITGTSEASEVRVDIEPLRGRLAPPPAAAEDGESLAMARQLVALSGGSLELALDSAQGTPFTASLVLPAAQQFAVMVIDDNVDTQLLFRRYLEGTRYPFVGARDPEQALALARELSPQIILLDVMLPGIDGWEVLGRLREHPVTRGIPVIVCTILPQERLAVTLGAAGFLRKPVTRGALLAALDAQVDRYLRPARGPTRRRPATGGS